MNPPFYEQVSALAGRFESWGACERTVVLVALLRRVPWPGLRLAAHAAEAALLQAKDGSRLEAEANANDMHFLRAAHAMPPKRRLAVLLAHLPLLRPGNAPAKALYLAHVPALLRHCVQAADDVDRCQEMLSYLLIHPALDDADRRSLGRWLAFLETHVLDPTAQPAPPPPPATSFREEGDPTFRRTIGKNVDFKRAVEESAADRLHTNSETPADDLQESFSKNGKEIEVDDERDEAPFDPAIAQPKARRSNSLTPPSASRWPASSSSENLRAERFAQKPRSFSLSSERSLFPQPNGDGEIKLDGVGDRGGMSAVAHWLKTLRLHKYAWLFSNLSYDQMMAIDEDYLQRLGVTKGARHKLLLSIRKLSERESALEEMEHELSDGGFTSIAGVTSLLERLRSIVVSPIKPDSTLAMLVVRVLDLASARILSGGSTCRDGGPAVSLHCWLVDRALAHDAFTRSPNLAAELKSLKYRIPPRQFLAHLGDAPFQRRTKPRWRNCVEPESWQTNGDVNRKSSSFPSFPPVPPLPPPEHAPPASTMVDINSRLESLCLQMTEQAIN